MRPQKLSTVRSGSSRNNLFGFGASHFDSGRRVARRSFGSGALRSLLMMVDPLVGTHTRALAFAGAAAVQLDQRLF